MARSHDSTLTLPDRTLGAATAHTSVLVGLEANPIAVEVTCSRGPAFFQLVGLAEAAVREARVRVASALSRLGGPARRVRHHGQPRAGRSEEARSRPRRRDRAGLARRARSAARGCLRRRARARGARARRQLAPGERCAAAADRRPRSGCASGHCACRKRPRSRAGGRRAGVHRQLARERRVAPHRPGPTRSRAAHGARLRR